MELQNLGVIFLATFLTVHCASAQFIYRIPAVTM